MIDGFFLATHAPSQRVYTSSESIITAFEPSAALFISDRFEISFFLKNVVSYSVINSMPI